MRRVLALARKVPRALARRWRAAGVPYPKETWESQYASGHWDSLDSVDNLPPYAIVAAYVHRLHPDAAVLDVGCGAGNLARLLARLGFRRLVGIDVSAEAIHRARSLGLGNSTFVAAAYEDWDPSGRFDVIVFCESLFYASRPAEVLLRFGRALEPGGSLVVSMFRFGYVPPIWKSLDPHFVTVHSMKVENDKGMRWDVKVLRPAPR